jgi:deazaflavin-dependent oxidoreductase (nitroreductase family)
MHGAPVLLLTAVGRKTGRKHTTPVLYVRDGNRIAVVASNGGRNSDPSWWKNLRHTPEAQIRIKGDELRVRAERASDEEKIRLWPILAEMYPGYDGYQRKTKRELPVVLLTPLNDSSTNWSQ